MRPGRYADSSPASSAIGHERVEQHFYSPYGPYGLYRASVPVQGCTLPYLFFTYHIHIGIPFVPVLWDFESSVPVSRQIRFGTPKVTEFSVTKTHF
jgi:hypothetical protein